MSTLASTSAYTGKSEQIHTAGFLTRYNQWLKKMQFNYYGIIAMTIGSCLGAIATMMVFENHASLWQFVLALGLAMGNNVAAISQAPFKWVVNIFILNIIVNSLILALNISWS